MYIKIPVYNYANYEQEREFSVKYIEPVHKVLKYSYISMELIKIIKTIVDSRPRDENEIILPIECINELPVVIKLTINPNLENYLFFVDVESKNIYSDETPLVFLTRFFYDIPISNPIIDADDFITKFKKIVNSLSFDKEKGIVTDGRDIKDNNFFRDLIQNPNISFIELDTCAVCFDKTRTKTPCEHTLCFVCWSNMKTKTCPICREEL